MRTGILSAVCLAACVGCAKPLPPAPPPSTIEIAKAIQTAWKGLEITNTSCIVGMLLMRASQDEGGAIFVEQWCKTNAAAADEDMNGLRPMLQHWHPATDYKTIGCHVHGMVKMYENVVPMLHRKLGYVVPQAVIDGHMAALWLQSLSPVCPAK